MMNSSASTASKITGKVSPLPYLTPESLKKALNSFESLRLPLALPHHSLRCMRFFQDGVVRCEKISLYCAAFIGQISWYEVGLRRLCGTLSISTPPPVLFLQHIVSGFKKCDKHVWNYLEPKKRSLIRGCV